MSNQETGNEPALDLTGLDFGPSWAKSDAPARDYSKDVGPRDNRPPRRGKGPRRDGERRHDDRRNNNNRDRNDRRDNRRQGGGGRREPRQETPAPEGFTASIMPVEEGLDNLAREIQGGGRCYSVFDLARVVMGARERFNVVFQAPDQTKFYRCKVDGSIWLTKSEALQQFWKGNLVNELYEAIETEAEAPTGNFTSVAKCGLSGEWLGPPNFHSYQSAVAQLHRERFSHISLEDFKRKIRVESGEEAVNAWIESQKKQVHYRPLTTDEILAKRKAASKEATAEQSKTDAPAETPAAQDSPAEPATAETTSPEEEPTPTPESDAAPQEEATTDDSTSNEAPEAAAEETPAPSDADLIKDRNDLQRHFADHHFKNVFAESNRAWVPGSIAGKLLSPGLLTLLKETVAEERRYPAKLTPVLCRQLSGRHLAVFKWKKKLKAGPARPHAVPDDISLADRPKQLLNWIESNSGHNLEALWTAVFPQDASDEQKRAFYHDLHWLLNQGYVILLDDSTVHLAKSRTPETPAPPKEKPTEDPQTPPENEPPTNEEPSPPAEPPAEADQSIPVGAPVEDSTNHSETTSSEKNSPTGTTPEASEN
ncbi:MAG: hypothetical protein AAGC74_08785 [Verrucomicrobiota bacterium]